MKTVFLIITCLLIGFSSFSQGGEQDDHGGEWFGKKPKYRNKEYKSHRNLTDDVGRKQGTWVLFSTYQNLVYKTEYKDNARHGVHEAYYPSTGLMRESMEYFDGKRDGPFASYYYTGQLKQEGEYVLGKKENKWSYYHRITGELKAEGMYVKNRRDGLWKFFDSKGQQTKTLMYKNGVPYDASAEAKKIEDAKAPAADNKKPDAKKGAKKPTGTK